MKINQKILCIAIVSILISISFNVVQAVEINDNSNQKDKSIIIEIGEINNEGNSIIETTDLTDDQLDELELILSEIIISIESAKTWEEINIILNNYENMYINKKGPIIDLIKKIIYGIKNIIYNLILKLKGAITKGFVISYGRSYKLNIFKTRELMRMRKNICIWHYSKGLTVMWKPGVHKTLNDMQIGWMMNFNGLYMFITNKFPQKCFTFFVGMPKIVNGIPLFEKK